ncbi:hypothetical protein ASG68_24220 [Rhizobium sp. Leaf453]|nr:hypothetical protein ASG50_28655 [Rhizobium sp. Leaf386]KQU05880.1 hypothetical protein ASG68_24220 [Rhizobium sp. Leaf453]
MAISSELIGSDLVNMLRRVLVTECARREISPDNLTGQDLALVLSHAFNSGMTEENELVVLLRNLSD